MNENPFVSLFPGQDFHVPGQTFSAQPGGQVGGGGGIGVSGARGPVVGGIPTVAPNLSGLPLRISPPGQSIASAYSKSQASHLLSSSSGLHTQSTSEMGKQTHLQNQPPSMQQVYLQNAGRSVSQVIFI
ncbi:hypothetical protein QAD02_007294 [Eretmocerus hayati]|uniref:Uncharacterized protein n=1 Tax=Eretmocerus hayati TaxID=131215 RepID=A0ACC2N3L0_9HYME|nr:hypothetical protein QAD02_007294 [Eretmocerus hayati]